jgi:4-alpha-glucanotransferase
VIGDLAIGSAPDSADVWSNRALFADGASLGAPPDAYTADGQNWGLPPLVPWRMREQRFAFVRRLLRAAFRGAGGLRVDHVMGLMRLFWIADGRPGSEGAYVRQPLAELLAILAVESRRARALVIGEDLGTVPPELGPELASFGILSTRVLSFERTGNRFHPRQAYPARALALASTHDLPPLAGYFAGRDVELRAGLRDAVRTNDVAAALRGRADERAALIDVLRADGALPAGEASVSEAALTRAAHEFLARSPAKLVALSLDDLAGETEPLNLPGVPVEKHRSWSRRMTRTLDEIAERAEAPRR